MAAHPLHAARRFDVRDFGARGDGRTLDTEAINRAVQAALAAGGGEVHLPAGRYLSFSIRLGSNIALSLGDGAVLEAADPARHAGRYDPPEGGGGELYQDFGHSHWHNSLIWAEDCENVAILGPGLIDGAGLTRDGPGARWRKTTGERPLSMRQMSEEEIRALEPDRARMVGLGNKAIAFRNVRNAVLSGFRVLKGGHFALLATGVEDMVIRDLLIDTDRDGLDLDCVRNVVVERCRVNAPNDDAIVLKSSFALGEERVTQNVVIRDCEVSGFDMGSLMDGTRRRTQELAPDRDRVTGRIKLGTESNGGFRNIAIRDCRFERSRGLALETVDGAVLEDVVASGLTMRDVTTAPLFLRLGARLRGPEGTQVGALRRVAISEVEATGIDPRFAATIAGLPGHAVEDVSLSDVHLVYRGGIEAAEPHRSPPELEDAYPEPSMFGMTPAWGLWARHVAGLRLDRVRVETEVPDGRPGIVTEDVTGLRIDD